jgi:hypothetical protein
MQAFDCRADGRVRLVFTAAGRLQRREHNAAGPQSVAVGASGLSPLVAPLRRRSLPSYGELEAHVRASAVVGIDERGLWQHGVRGDWWLARTEQRDRTRPSRLRSPSRHDGRDALAARQ